MKNNSPKKSTREKILEATIELLWQHSYGSVSVDDICQAAEVQKGSFYHYFPSKVDVVIQSFDKLWEDSKPVIDNIFLASLGPIQRLDNYCDFMYQKQKEKSERLGKVLGCPYVTCGSELSTLEERVRHKLNEIFSLSAGYFEILLRDAKIEGLTSITDPQNVAQKMLSYIAGVMYQAKLKNDVEIIKRDLRPGLIRYFDLVKSELIPELIN